MRLAALIFVFMAALPMGAQPGPHPAPGATVEKMTGTIESIHLDPGAGAPYLEVKQGDRITTVRLGPLRYLIEQGFNPKAGLEVVVEGYRSGDVVTATQVSLPSENKTLRLRDEDGLPLWRGARRRRGRQESSQ